MSDDSDEEYRVEEDEIDDQSDDIVSLVGDASEEEGFSGFAEEEDEEDDVASVRTVHKSKSQNGSSRREKGLRNSRNRKRSTYDDKDDDFDDEDDEDAVSVSVVPKSKPRNGTLQRKNGSKMCTNRKRSTYNGKDDDDEYENEEDEEEDEGDDFEYNEEEEDEEDAVSVCRVHKSNNRNEPSQRKNWSRKSAKRKRSLYDGKDDVIEDEEEDDDDYEDDDDEEFTPDDLDSMDEEEFLSATENIDSNGWHTVKKKGPLKIQKSKSGAKTIRKPLKKKRKTTKTKRKSNGRNHSKKVPRSGRKSKRKPPPRKKMAEPCSDSDFVSSEASDVQYTISEEEREQIREANEFCRRADTALRCTNLILNDAPIDRHRPQPKAKGKQKLEDVKNDAGKPICGICFTEECKTTVRGTLNSCSHFFCFACIMEWSKVESRCPMCKQRFSTISKPVRSAIRNVVIHVPERDQVYQPSEEELRNYLDPYENMICTECHEGGDDALMLLCDICDSPAHTYCVGLGREVPEGNWYCEGCRPSSQHSQAQENTPTRRSGTAGMLNEPYENMAEIDLNVSVPETPMTPLSEFLPSPRNQGGGNPPQQPSVPLPGLGVSTLSGRRRVHRFQYLMSSNRLSQMAGISDRSAMNAAVSNLLASQMQRVNESSPSFSFTENRIADVGPSAHSLQADRVDPFGSRTQGGDNIQVRQGLSRGQALVPGTVDSCLQWGATNGSHLGIGGLSVQERLHPCSSRSDVSSLGSVPSSQNGNAHHQVKEQLYSMVFHQLKSFCRDVGLGHATVEEIAWSSVHLLLAACGLEHRRVDVYNVYVPPPICRHGHTWALEGRTCPMKDCCQSCFDSFVEDAVRTVVNEKAPRLGYRRN